MNHPTPHPAAEVDPVLLALLALWLAAEAAAVLIVGALALLLTLAGWRPSQTAAAVVQTSAPCAEPAPLPLPVIVTPAPVALPPAPAAPLERLTVRELRAQARAAGLPQLARSGRRADLLAALAACPLALDLMPPIPAPLWAPDYAADLREEVASPEKGLGSLHSWAGLLEMVAACRLTPEALAALAAATARLEALREAAAAMDAAALALARQLEAMGPAA